MNIKNLNNSPYLKVKTVDVLDVYQRSAKGITGYAKVSKGVAPFVLEINSRHAGIFDITGDHDCLEIKLTSYGQAFYDGIMTYRNERT